MSYTYLVFTLHQNEAKMLSESVEATVMVKYLKHDDPRTKNFDNVQKTLQGGT